MLPFKSCILFVLLGISRLALGAPVAQLDLDLNGELSAIVNGTAYADGLGLEDLLSSDLDLDLALGLDLDLNLK